MPLGRRERRRREGKGKWVAEGDYREVITVVQKRKVQGQAGGQGSEEGTLNLVPRAMAHWSCYLWFTCRSTFRQRTKLLRLGNSACRTMSAVKIPCCTGREVHNNIALISSFIISAT
jgi:hypothetical protein